MKLEISAEKAHWKRSLIMKVGSAVLAVHVAVACLFALTQGCVTSESQGSGRGAGARHKGPWKHEHKGVASPMVAQTGYYDQDMGLGSDDMYSDPLITSTEMASPIEPSPFAASVENTEVYIVQKGDILSQLAVDFDTTTATLVEMNGLSNPDVLYVGQELRVPAGRHRSGKSATISKPATAIKKGGSYTIQKGDTLSEIALAAGVGINDLRELNQIKDDKIFAGETIDIPSYGKVPSATRKSASSKKAESAPVEPAPSVAEPEPAPLAMAPAVEDAPVESAAPAVEMIEERILYPEETLDDIASQYGVSKAEIMRLNGIADESQVSAGDRLRIPIGE